jgi:hypothetical protein
MRSLQGAFSEWVLKTGLRDHMRTDFCNAFVSKTSITEEMCNSVIISSFNLDRMCVFSVRHLGLITGNDNFLSSANILILCIQLNEW